MGYAVGVGAALLVGAIGTCSGLDRDRGFYATILMVVGSYYDLFAAMAGSPQAFAAECAVLAVFIGLAVTGFRHGPWVVAAGLAGHGVFDLFHGGLIANPGVPVWWPAFCMSYDVTAAGYLSAILLRRTGAARLAGAFNVRRWAVERGRRGTYMME